MITASLATYPPRAAQVEQTVKSLVNQCDKINVYFNQYTEIPAWLKALPNCEGRLGANIGDAGKFAWTTDVTGYHLICDDDIFYPPDYAANMVAGIEKYQRQAVVGLHGVWIKEPVTSYYRDRKKISAATGLEHDLPCHLLATNTVAYHTDTLKICPRDFPVPNYADPFFAVLTQKQKVPCLCLARRDGWIRWAPVQESLYEKFRHGNDDLHSVLVRLLQPWKLWQLKQGTVVE